MRRFILLFLMLIPIIGLTQQEEYGNRKFINWKTGDTLSLSFQDSIIRILLSDSVDIVMPDGTSYFSGWDKNESDDSDDQILSIDSMGRVFDITIESGNTVTFQDTYQDGDTDSNNEIQDIATDGTSGDISISDGSSLILNVDDADADATNEYNTGVNWDNTNKDIEITDNGGTKSATITGFLESESDPVYSGDAASNITDAGSGSVITSTERTNFNTAYDERGSVIDGNLLNWDGAELDVNDDLNLYDNSTSGFITSSYSHFSNTSNPHSTTLQGVTDAGNSTSNSIEVGRLDITSNDGNYAALDFNDGSGNREADIFKTIGGAFHFRVQDVDAIEIDTNQNVSIPNGVLQVDGTGDSYFQGNVGIGTTSPSNKLTVGDPNSNDQIILQGYDTDDGLKYVNQYINSSGQWTWGGDNYGVKSSIDMSFADAVFRLTSGGRIEFGWGDMMLRYSEDPDQMYFTGGNVGIGTTSPTEKLDVDGNIKTSGKFVGDTSLARLEDLFTNSDETDPIFSSHLASDITSTDTTRWGTDTDTSNEIQSLDLTNNTLSLSQDGSVDLSSYLDNTDDQTLSFTSPNLSIESGNSVDLSPLQDGIGTDDQNLSVTNLTGNSLRLDIENGNNVTINGGGNTSVTQNTSQEYTISSSYTETDPVYSGDPAFGITSTDINQWDEAYSERGSVIDGNLLNWDGAELDVNDDLSLYDNSTSGFITSSYSHFSNTSNPHSTTLQGVTDAGDSTSENIRITGSDEWTELKSAGIYINRGTGYLAPVSNQDKNLNIGSHSDGVADWNTINYRALTHNFTQGNVNITDGNLQVDGTEDSYFQGNVGIGTTSPNFEAEIQYSDSHTGGNFYENKHGLRIHNTAGTGTYSALTLGKNDAWTIKSINNDNNDYDLQFMRWDSWANSDNVRVHFDNNGNVGIGTTSPTEALDVDGNGKFSGNLQVDGTGDSYFQGNVGIGTTSPGVKLGVSGNVRIGVGAVGKLLDVGIPEVTGFNGYGVIYNAENYDAASFGRRTAGHEISAIKLVTMTSGSTTSGARIAMLNEDAGTVSTGQLQLVVGSGTGTNVMNLLSNGNVGIGTTSPDYKLDVSGQIYSNNNMYADDFVLNSDRRFKTNIETLGNSEDALNLNPVQFNWKENGKFDIGFVAQELQKKYPYLVKERNDGYLGISYSKITALNNALIQDLWDEMESIKEENKQLHSKVDSLENKVNKMEKWLKENTSY